MNKRKETVNAHSCKYTQGKIFHIEVDMDGKVYCARCKQRLLITQVADKWKKLFKEKR